MTDPRIVVAGRLSGRLALVGICVAVLGLPAAAAGSETGSNRVSPRAPTALRVSASERTSLSLAWRAAADKAGLSGYYVYRGGRRLASVKTTRYTFHGLRCGTSYLLGVAAHGAKGGVSRHAAIIEATDGCAPPRPSGGTLIVNASKDFDFTDPSLTWSTAVVASSSTQPGSSSTTTRTSRRRRAARSSTRRPRASR